MSGETVKAIVLAVIGALIFSAGWLVEGWRKDAQIADLKAAQKAAESRVAQAAIGRLSAAEKRANDLQIRLAAEETARDQLSQEKTDAIRRLTTGRRCLDSTVVRVLNANASLKPAAVPAAPGEPLRTDAAFATDADVGLWANRCQRSYDTCRGRLKAIAVIEKGLSVE